MKHFTMNLMIAATAMALAAGTATAQAMKADVPFAFHAGNKVMEAGSYQVTLDPMKGYVLIQNDAYTAATFLQPMANLTGKAGDARLVFSCVSEKCVLAQAWSGRSAAYAFFTPKDRNHDATLYTIRLRRQ